MRVNMLPNLPKCTKSLLKSNVKFNIRDMEAADGTIGQFHYFGIKKKLESTVIVELHETNIIELIVNIDGFSPFKSSSITVWPTLCKVYTKEDKYYEPFSASVYAGNAKPKNSFEYLSEFGQEISELQSVGLKIQNNNFQVKIKFFTGDTPARSYLKCVLGHVALDGCERCEVVGKKIEKVSTFMEVDERRKTDDGFRRFTNPKYHTGVSLLSILDPPINMVTQFVLDPMHLLYLGCTKRILDYLLSSSKRKVRLSAAQKSELERRTVQIHPNIPDEFPRKLRSSKEWTKYKAVEFRFFILYAAPVIFNKVLSDDLYKHLMLLNVACRLMSSENPIVHVDTARQYLKSFVEKASGLFGSTFMSLNVHNLIHICDDVENMNCNLSQLSAFCFESHLGKISSALRSPKNIVAQYCRRVQEKEMFGAEISSNATIYILQEDKSKIIKVKYHGMILSHCDPNNTVLLQDKSIAEIIKIYKDNDNICVQVKRYLRKENIFSDPCDSSCLNMWQVSHLSPTVLHISLNLIVQKFVKLEMSYLIEEETKTFVFPLLH